MYVGLHDDVHEGFEEAEDQPAVDHLDVGGGGEVGAHTNNNIYLTSKKGWTKKLSLEKALLELTRLSRS